MSDEHPKRSRPAHGVFSEFNKPPLVFVTVCTKGREPWLASDLYHDLLLDVWGEATHWRVGRYVLMPDHLHFFAAQYEPEFPLENWMKYWRSQFVKRNPDKVKEFQGDYWDRRLRSGESYGEKWDYVRHNPVRKGLVENWDDWRFAGELFELRW